MRRRLVGFGLGMLLALGLAAPAWAQATAPATTTKTQVKKKATAKVDLNTATADELQELPGIGPARAAAIIKARPFKTVADLKDVEGISPRVYDELAPLVTVAAPAAKKSVAKEAMKKAETKAKTAAKTATTAPAGGKVDLNTATAEELEELPGIGPARAEAIIAARPFKSVADLKKVEEVPARVYGEIEPRLLASQPAVVESKTAPAKPAARPASASPRAKAAAKEAEKEEDPAQHSKKKAALAPGRKININSASADELQELPGIGPVRSEAIIKGRPYETIEDVMKVDGIKEGVFGWIKDHISVK